MAKSLLPCKIDGCNRRSIGRGWCAAHYWRWQTYGDPQGTKKTHKPLGEPCSVEECNRPIFKNGLCHRHDRKLRLYGDHAKGLRTENGEPARYLQEVVLHYEDPVECLLWPYGRMKSGYATIGKGRDAYVHRRVCENRHGPAPTPNHIAAHSCGNGHLGCVNRFHLRWATYKENSEDAAEHGTQAKGSRIGNSKLTEEDVRKILTRTEFSSRQMERVFGVSSSSIRRIRARKSWTWLD